MLVIIRSKRPKPHPRRPRLVPRRPTNQKSLRKPWRRPGRKRKGRGIKENKTDEKDETIAPPLQELMPLRPQSAKRRSDALARALRRTSLRLPTITTIRRATTPGSAPSQKTSCCLADFHVGDC